jgi:hypothetical protein
LKWRQAIYAREPGQPRRAGLVPSLSLERPVSRQELESLCRKSRPTVNRLVARWEKQGWLERTGNSRGTRYRLGKLLQKELNGGRIPT